MARFYSDENFPAQSVRELRRLGHEVLTSFEAGNANLAVTDEDVLRFATQEGRILVTQNRLHFLRLHRSETISHTGMVVCTYEPDFLRLALRIHELITVEGTMAGKALRVYRPAV